MIHEAQIEKNFIDILTQRENQWTYRSDIKTEAALWDNLRHHINRINRKESECRRLTATPFSASQWLRGENGIAAISIEREDISRGEVTLKVFSEGTDRSYQTNF